MSDFLQALRVQRRVVHAFIIRETRTRFDRSKLGYFWALFEPLAYIFSLVGIFALINRTAPIPVDIRLFFFTGIMPWLLFSKCVGSIGGAIDASQTLLNFPQVKTLDLVLARFILEFFTLVLVGFLYLAFFVFLTHQSLQIKSIISLVAAFFIAGMMGVGLGLISSVIKLYWSSYGNFQAIFLRVLFFTSGMFFVVETLPKFLQDWIWYNPIMHIIEWTRSSFFKTFHSDFYEIRYPIVFAMILLFLGLAAERVSRKRHRD